MKKLIFLLTIVTLFKCQNKIDDKGNASKEINEIVEAIIQQESLNVLLGNKGNSMFCRELRKITVESDIEELDGIVPPRYPGIFI